MQALGGPAEMKLGGDRHERFQLAQLHSLTVPRVPRTSRAQDFTCPGLHVPRTSSERRPLQELDCSAEPKSA